MATIIVSFETEREAQAAIERLTQANLGHVQARVLDDDAGKTSYSKSATNAPMVTPNGTLEVRPSDPPDLPEARDEGVREDASGSIPTTGSESTGVQVMIETDAENEEAVRRIISQRG